MRIPTEYPIICYMATRNFSISLPDEVIETIDRIKAIIEGKRTGKVSRNYVIRRWVEEGIRKWKKDGLLP